MAQGTLYTPQSGGLTDLLRTIIDILGGTGTNYGAEPELLEGIILNMQTPIGVQNNADLFTQPSTCVAATLPRSVAAESITIATVSGTIYMQAIYIPANTVVNNITTVTGSTASTNDVTINWAALCDSGRHVLAVSANATAQLTPAGFNNTLALTSSFTTTYSGLYYIAYTVGATTTQPTICGNTAAGTEVAKIAPILCGTSSTSSTSTPPTTGTQLGAITATASSIYQFLT